MIALYHRVMKRENFEKAAKDLFNLLKSAQIKFPNSPRALFLDIDGHRNDQGGFDSDMYELQKEFGISFLGKYFSEVHFPLIEFKNPNPQCNDIPQALEIFNAENKMDNSFNELFIENHSNTEFLSEPDVCRYMEKVRKFLIKYKEYDNDCLLHENNTNGFNFIRQWKSHINDLIMELYNVFLYGNFISAAAVTRTLIECFVYFNILSKEGNEHLVHEWYLCSTCCSFWQNKEKAKELIKTYCDVNGLDFNEKWETYTYNDTTNTNRWLRPIIPSGKLSFKAACEYLENDHVYKDYESACEFVHGQDLRSKFLPFTFYSSIAYRFHMMMSYIYQTVRLFPINEDLENEIYELENDLFDLTEKYCK